ncbi:CYTH and CHAD domain-containing protein [Corynebacterium sp. sy017]|nr:CYTH and CHAD domain-containing protein [Corynebacterium sp. sy017]TSD92555.1 CYTH and CHAD domain-containing protein [Corynebacterium sp. SY003]
MIMSIKEQLEVETKFSVAADTALPHLGAIEYITQVSEPEILELSATYFDTADLRLSKEKITLRRRSGGHDAGWHIKIPSSHGRIELHHEFSDEPPQSLLHFVRAIIRDEELVAIAEVNNERHQSMLQHGDHVVAEFCDDHVTATSFLPGGKRTQWREWEMELTTQAQELALSDALLHSAHTILTKAGAQLSHSPSKLLMALGDSIHNVSDSSRQLILSADHPAYSVLSALQASRDELIRWDPQVRRNTDDSVHQMRVASRQLRSLLQSFDGIIDRKHYSHVEDALKQLAHILGKARDAEVVAERFDWLLAQPEHRNISEEVGASIHSSIAARYHRAHQHILKALDSTAYITMLNQLDELIAQPVLAPASGASTSEELNAGQTLARQLEKSFAALKKRHKFAIRGWQDRGITVAEQENRVHDVRKAAKKLRYCSEAVTRSGHVNTKNLTRACKHLQKVLGDYQDALTSRDTIRTLAEQAYRNGQNTFEYGILYSSEEHSAQQALGQYDEAFVLVEKAYRQVSKVNKEQRTSKKKK